MQIVHQRVPQAVDGRHRPLGGPSNTAPGPVHRQQVQRRLASRAERVDVGRGPLASHCRHAGGDGVNS